MDAARIVEEKLAGVSGRVISMMLSGDLEKLLAEASSQLSAEAEASSGLRLEVLRSAALRLELLSQYVHALRIRHDMYGSRNLYREADYVEGVIMEVVESLRVALGLSEERAAGRSPSG